MRCFVLCKHNCEREYENGDLTPDPSPEPALSCRRYRGTLANGCLSEPALPGFYSLSIYRHYTVIMLSRLALERN
jgi:hypothetical protein